jgi:sugar fermentation stimulation protein A
LQAGQIAGLAGYAHVRPEVAYGHNSRVDFLLEGHATLPPAFVEVKNVHFSRKAGLAEFPDSVTLRGAKHLLELTAEIEKGNRAVVIFCIQREDVDRLDVARDLDPAFARAYDTARAAGLEVMAFAFGWSEAGIGAGHAVAVV